MNLRVAAMEKQGKALTGPGVPKSYPDAEKLVTEDWIRA